MVRGDAVSERYEVETTREGFKVTIRGAEVCHVEAFGSDAQSQIDAAVKANLIRAALNATEAGLLERAEEALLQVTNRGMTVEFRDEIRALLSAIRAAKGKQ